VPEQVLSWQPPAKTLEKEKIKRKVRKKVRRKNSFENLILFHFKIPKGRVKN
jgi:hypothetical protein